MRLSSIKLAGFKSFVEPTKIPFPDQMTCVVGPNGCGKSNVIDAVRWVLGESSAKNLRGDAMTDVIFNGSTKRKPISQASVELIFDNTQGRLPGTFADRNQIAIKRLVTRDGQSLYFLNGSKCRKRDITDIFLGTGLGPRSYAIIEQGMISRLIESKPQELRVFLEEAAGISKYKERRRETQTRIKSTRENMERLLDVRQELQSQLDKLSLQAEQASQYKSLKSQERALKAWIAVLKWQSLEQKQATKANEIAKLNEKLAFFSEAHRGHDSVLATLEHEITHLNDGYEQAQHSVHRIETQLATVEQQKVNLTDKKRQLLEQSQLLKSQQQEVTEAYDEQSQYVTASSEKVNETAEQLEIALLQLEEVQLANEQNDAELINLEEQLSAAQHGCQQTNTQLQQATSQLMQQQQEKAHIDKRQAELLAQLESHQGSTLKRDLAEAQDAHHQLVQAMAKLQGQASQLQAQEQTNKEDISLAQTQAREAAHALQEAQSEIKALSRWADETSEVATATMLSQLVVDSGYEECVEAALLGMTHLVVQQSEMNSIWPMALVIPADSVATKIRSGLFPSFLTKIKLCAESGGFVSCEQYVLGVTPSGIIVGDNFKAKAKTSEDSGALKRYAQLQSYRSKLPNLQQSVEDVEQVVAQKRITLEDTQAKLLETQQQVHEKAQAIASHKTKVEMLDEHLSAWRVQGEKMQQQLDTLAQAKREVIEQVELYSEEQLQLETLLEQAQQSQLLVEGKLSEFKQQSQSRRAALQETQQLVHTTKLAAQQAESEQQLSNSKLEHLQHRREEIAQRIEQTQEDILLCDEPLVEANEQIEILLAQHLEAKAQKQTMFDTLQQAKEKLSQKQAALKDASTEVNKLNESLQQLKLDEQGLMLKAQAALEPLEALGRTLKTELAQLPTDANLGQYQASLNRVSSDLGKLGAVNLAAIEEFEEAKERKTYLDTQLDDLTNALETLEAVIRKIDKETKTRFSATFNQVNEDLAELFPKVFGGGNAYLELTSDDLLESGVSIMARPPGKKNSTIHLLSGGEKALTALSLVFSIFRLNPAPFCMLDEVDAPLDDANVGRFCRLVEEMSQTVQFIYISHNKVAMEMAGRLTGVTMAEPGVSRMVAVDIEQAVQMAQA
ncbi:AAA family ATPase [Pseudoalteromonas piscicida]|uniref:Chromosome partition protein Smc n=1 Tax=Pseudoalteromonas piscicida TaxID=43662 RepID=A0A2A5JK77_PSEO7|nr:AAA family ATPase [Pseudoalteromonas piscicida]PCK29840.1 chromosome segregation protein SMC [Pseudoalteromonas piscicida]